MPEDPLPVKPRQGRRTGGQGDYRTVGRFGAGEHRGTDVAWRPAPADWAKAARAKPTAETTANHFIVPLADQDSEGTA